MKYIILYCITAFLAFSVYSQSINNNYTIRKVVIDAGHGGKDPGALGENSQEKAVTLAVALKLGEYIKQYLKDVEVIYTRTSDKFIELHKRAEIANEAQADVFISIHVNSTSSQHTHGTESWVLGLHKSAANLDVSKRENAVIELEDNLHDHYYTFNPNSQEGHIIMSMKQNAHLEQSINLANKIQNQFEKRVGRNNRGIKQAGFMVLYKTVMPSVLVELGFLTNSQEEAFLMSEQGQVYLASAIYRAFKAYKIEVEKNAQPLKNTSANTGKEKKSNSIDYRIQLLASYNKKSPVLKQISDVKIEKHGKIYKYIQGMYSSKEKAYKALKAIKKKGYKDAFVVLYKNGVRWHKK